MVAWKSTLKPSEIAQVSSYVISLRGTNPPDAKAPEGDLYADPNAAAEEAAQEMDSTGVEMGEEPTPELPEGESGE
jgi:cytochrome c oxidase cbb3-type subunit 3